MAGNAFVIPGYNVDIMGAAQRAKERNLAQQQLAYQNLMNGFNAVGQVGKEYAARKFQEEEAEKARAFQAEEAAKARQHQREMQEEQLAAQQAYNNNLRSVEEAKLAAKEKEAAQATFAEWLPKEDSPARTLILNNLKNKYPDIDQYDTGETVPLIFPNGGQPVKKSLTEELAIQRQAAADKAAAEDASKAENSYALAKFRADNIPKTIKNEAQKKMIRSKIDKSPFTAAEKAEMYKEVDGLESQQTKVKKAVEGAVAGNAGKVTTEKLTDEQAKTKAKGYVGKKMNALEFNKLPEEVKKHLKRNAQNIVEEA